MIHIPSAQNPTECFGKRKFPVLGTEPHHLARVTFNKGLYYNTLKSVQLNPGV
jgi:hypothetical protein